MNDKIDVLAVLARDAVQAVQYRVIKGENSFALATESDDARAAIAELIEKAETAEQALRNLVAAGAHPNWANYADDLRAALAKVGGA